MPPGESAGSAKRRRICGKTFAGPRQKSYLNQRADAAELVDARDLKSLALFENVKFFCQTASSNTT
jgi:hypothetical protein